MGPVLFEVLAMPTLAGADRSTAPWRVVSQPPEPAQLPDSLKGKCEHANLRSISCLICQATVSQHLHMRNKFRLRHAPPTRLLSYLGAFHVRPT